jgi:transcriptional regulator with XRE-family HTH domain
MTKTPNPVDRFVGSRVRMQRLLAGMSQEKLGDALGLTFQQVQKYEKGTNRISASRLQQLAKILGVPVSFFFDGAPLGGEANAAGFEETGQQAYISEFMTTSEGLQLTKAFMRIGDPAVRRRVIDLVEALAGSPAKSL